MAEMVPNRMKGCAVYESTSAPVPVTAYKTPAWGKSTEAFLKDASNTVGTAVKSVTRTAKIATATVLDKLTNNKFVTFIKNLASKLKAAFMYAANAVAWIAGTVKSVTKLISDTVKAVHDLSATLAALVKQSGIWQLANALCGGLDLSGIAASIASIQTQMDFDKVVDYALEGLDSSLLGNIKNCQLFKPGTKDKLKAALKNVFASSNFIMLDCMKDVTDYTDVPNVNRNLRGAAIFMSDDTMNAAALNSIAAYMNTTNDFMFLVENNDRFPTKKVYELSSSVELIESVPVYSRSTIGDTNARMIGAAASYIG